MFEEREACLIWEDCKDMLAVLLVGEQGVLVFANVLPARHGTACFGCGLDILCSLPYMVRTVVPLIGAPLASCTLLTSNSVLRNLCDLCDSITCHTRHDYDVRLLDRRRDGNRLYPLVSSDIDTLDTGLKSSDPTIRPPLLVLPLAGRLS